MCPSPGRLTRNLRERHRCSLRPLCRISNAGPNPPVSLPGPAGLYGSINKCLKRIFRNGCCGNRNSNSLCCKLHCKEAKALSTVASGTESRTFPPACLELGENANSANLFRVKLRAKRTLNGLATSFTAHRRTQTLLFFGCHFFQRWCHLPSVALNSRHLANQK